ncbi:unnamed protein product, partial [Iphiclides podalirius]
MGLVPEGSISSYVEADSTLLWPVPNHWGLEEAATVILPYVHAYYCILKDENIGCINAEAYHQVVLENTDNNLCDIVFNSASGALRETFFKFVGQCGVFLDVNKHDVFMNSDYNFGNNSVTSLSISAALNGLELGIEYGYTKVLAINKKEKRRDKKSQVLNKVTDILGVKDLDQIDGKVALGEIITNINILEEIRTLVKNEFRLNHTLQCLEKISLESLKNTIRNARNITKQKFGDGIAAFISTIEDEIDVTTTDYFRTMPTLMSRNLEVSYS